MALRGNLRDFSLPDVFQLVTFSQKTGVLRIAREDGAEGSVWFREGEVFFASSNWHADPLGQRLVNAQRITPQALKKALELRATEPDDGRRLGQILIDEGYITDKVLESFVSEQIQDTIFDLMRWDDGDFDFEAMPDAVEEDIGLTVSIENVVMEGSRRLEEWSRIKKKIPSTDVVFKMATAPGEGTFEISLKPIEWQLLLLVDGTRSVSDLAVETGRTDFDVARIIYGLFSAGLLEFATEEEIKHNRAERDAREAKLAEIEAERRRIEDVEKQAALEREASLAAQADRRREEAEAKQQPVQPAAVVPEVAAEAGPVEEPEFLAGGVVSPTVEDQAALDEFMGAVLGAPAAVPAGREPVAPVEPAQPYVPAEEPAFISAGRDEGAEDEQIGVSSVEELLGITPAAPEPAPAEEPSVSEPEPELQVEPAPEPEVLLMPEPEPETAPDMDFERDLMALGLGELPSDLLEPMGAPAEATPVADEIEELGVAEPASVLEFEPLIEPEFEQQLEPEFEPHVELEPELMVPLEPLGVEPELPPTEPMSETPVWVEEEVPEAEVTFVAAEELPELEIVPAVVEESEQLEPAAADEAMDFSALIESLDIDADDSGSLAVSSGFDADLLRDEATALAGGVISTDAYLEDIGIDDLGYTGALSGGFTDELSALTGAQRRAPVRPQASVNAIPEEGSGVIRRDARVDKDTLLKIIDGIKKL